MFGGPRLVRRPLGIIHVTDVYVVFRLRRHKLWLSRAPGYLGTRDEKSGLIQEPKRKSWLKLRNWVYNLRRPGRQNGDLVNITNAKFVWKFMIALGRRSLMKPVRTMGAAVCAGALVAVALALSDRKST